MKYIFITNHPETAKIAFQSGVQRIMVDLESNGKFERQGHLDTFISQHQFEDIAIIRKAVPEAELLVRLNVLHEHTEVEIHKAVDSGANFIMQPYFTSFQEVASFSHYIPYSIGFIPLFEHYLALQELDKILTLSAISEIYLGLNDLHLSLKQKFMFEPLANGDVDVFAHKAKKKALSFGFGGVATIGEGVLSAQDVLKEHARVGSTRVILGRSFRKFFENISDYTLQEKKMKRAIEKLTDVYKASLERTENEEQSDKAMIHKKIRAIASA